MAARQHSTPTLVRGDAVVPLIPIPLEDNRTSEEWFQSLLFANPSLLPIADIEPGFGRLISAARELPTGRGPVDLLLFDTHGHLVLVETKLWRNPEARRKVIGQIIDYATVMSAWTYDDLLNAVRAASSQTTGDPLTALAAAEEGPEFDEARFVDAVTTNLRRGRFLLLIVGEGIRESVEQMVTSLDRSPQLGFRFGLIEVALFRSDQAGDVYVQPRILATTREVVRAVVEVRPGTTEVVVREPDERERVVGRARKGGRGSLTEEEYFTRLRAVDPEVAGLVAEVLREAPDHNLDVEWKPNGPILKYCNEASEDSLNFGQLSPKGTLDYTGWLSAKCNRLDLPDSIWHDYYRAVANLLGAVRLKESQEKGVSGTSWEIVTVDGHVPPAAPLLRARRAWFDAIDVAVTRAETAMDANAV